MNHSGKEGGPTSTCTKCGEVVPSSKRRSHYRLKHPLPSDLRAGQPAFFTCGCGAEVSKFSKHAHRLSCPLMPGYVAPEPAYTKTKRLCDYEACGTEYTPKAPSQRYCKPACKVADAKPLDEDAREQSYLAPLQRAEDDLARRCREAGEALMNRERSYELWNECLNVKQEAA